MILRHRVILPYQVRAMDQLVTDIEAFSAALGITPQKLLRDSVNAEWGRWQKWKAGEASPTMLIADRIRAHMAANWPATAPLPDSLKPYLPPQEAAE